MPKGKKDQFGPPEPLDQEFGPPESTAAPATTTTSTPQQWPITPQPGEDFASTMKRGVAAGKAMTPAELQAHEQQTIKDAPRTVPETLATAALAGPATMMGEIAAPSMAKGALEGSIVTPLVSSGYQAAVHGRLPTLNSLGEAALAGGLSGAVLGPLAEFGGPALVEQFPSLGRIPFIRELLGVHKMSPRLIIQPNELPISTGSAGDSLLGNIVTPGGEILPNRASAGSPASALTEDLDVLERAGDRGARAELARRIKLHGGPSAFDYSKFPLPKD